MIFKKKEKKKDIQNIRSLIRVTIFEQGFIYLF